jgi:hypothetical protein
MLIEEGCSIIEGREEMFDYCPQTGAAELDVRYGQAIDRWDEC